MKQIFTFLANSNVPEQPLEPAALIIDQELVTPKDESFIQWEIRATNEAEKIEQFLVDHLPGGIYDRVMARMCARKASLYKVKLPTE